MENKKTKIAIIIVVLLIVTLIVISYFYNDYSSKQVNLLTQQVNKILEINLIEDNIDFSIKTEKNYAKVENGIKEYISKLKNIYLEMEQMVLGINPNSIFSVQNMPDKTMDKVENIIEDYKEKSQNFISEYENLITEEKILEEIKKANISNRKDYYINLYSEVMLSKSMKNQYLKLEEEVKNAKGTLYEKLNKIEKMKTFLQEHDNDWEIKEGKIHFINLNRMTEYYSLFNQVID